MGGGFSRGGLSGVGGGGYGQGNERAAGQWEGSRKERPGGGRIADYTRDPDDDAPVDVAAVEALLDERSRMRERRLWNEADGVRCVPPSRASDVSGFGCCPAALLPALLPH